MKKEKLMTKKRYLHTFGIIDKTILKNELRRIDITIKKNELTKQFKKMVKT